MEQRNNNSKGKKSTSTEPGNPGIEKHEWPMGPIASPKPFSEEASAQVSNDECISKKDDKYVNNPDQWSVSWP